MLCHTTGGWPRSCLHHVGRSWLGDNHMWPARSPPTSAPTHCWLASAHSRAGSHSPSQSSLTASRAASALTHQCWLAGSAPAYIMWEGAGWGQPHVAGQKPAQLACALTHTHSLSRVDRSHSSTSPYSMQEEVARVQPNVAGQS